MCAIYKYMSLLMQQKKKCPAVSVSSKLPYVKPVGG